MGQYHGLLILILCVRRRMKSSLILSNRYNKDLNGRQADKSFANGHKKD